LIRRVVEGEKDDEGSDEEESDEEEDRRRRTVCLLKGRLLKVLERGISGFEESLEKRVEKLMAS
jgi:TATA-binding protein-associated factor Taf7